MLFALKTNTFPLVGHRDRRGAYGLRCAGILFLSVAMFTSAPASAQTCVTESKMAPAERETLAAVARSMSANALSGNAGALKDASVPDLQRDFAGVASAVVALHDASSGTVTLEGIFLLDNAVARTPDEESQFFCGAYSTGHNVTFTLPGLKPSRYAVVFVHVTGTAEPKQLSYVLQDLNGWKLAGFVQKPLQQGGHDGVWWWQHARELVKQHELWNASLCFQIARQLVTPVGFVSSANLDKLIAEQQAAQPVDWPSEDQPYSLRVDGKPELLTDITAVVSPHNAPEVTATVTYRASKPSVDGTKPDGAPADSTVGAADSSGVQAEQQAIGAELQRKVPELQSFLTQLVIAPDKDPGGQATVLPIKRRE